MRFFENVQITVLDNGFTVATDHFPGHARTAGSILWASGGFHDPDGQSGCAHLVEHLFTHAHPRMSQKDFRRQITKLAVNANITTNRDHIQAHAFGRTKSVMEILENAAVMIGARRIADEHHQHERRVVHKEQTDALNDREGAYRYKRTASIFGEHSRTVLPEGGLPDQIATIGKDQLLGFWEDHAVGSNMMFISAGGLSHAEAVAFAKTHFESLPVGYRRPRFGDRLRMTDVAFPQAEYQDVSFWARMRFEATPLFSDPVISKKLDLMDMFLTEALHDTLRLEDGTLYGGAKVAFAEVCKGRGFFTVHAECTPDDYIEVYSRIAETLNGIAMGRPEYESLFQHSLASVSNIVAEHAADLSENMAMRRKRIIDGMLHHNEAPDVLAEQSALESTTYAQAAGILRTALASTTPTTEYWGHIGPEQMNGRKMAAFFRGIGASRPPIAAVA